MWNRMPVLGAAAIGLLGAASLQAQSYIGAGRCGTCHEFAYGVWAAGPHAGAHKTLTPFQLTDPKCNTCHMTVPGETEARFAGVQCERCHGPGGYYHRRYVMRDRELAHAVGLVAAKAEHCLQCHTEGTPSIRKFDFTDMWRRIDHGREARLRAAAATPGPASAAAKQSETR